MRGRKEGKKERSILVTKTEVTTLEVLFSRYHHKKENSSASNSKATFSPHVSFVQQLETTWTSHSGMNSLLSQFSVSEWKKHHIRILTIVADILLQTRFHKQIYLQYIYIYIYNIFTIYFHTGWGISLSERQMMKSRWEVGDGGGTGNAFHRTQLFLDFDPTIGSVIHRNNKPWNGMEWIGMESETFHLHFTYGPPVSWSCWRFKHYPRHLVQDQFFDTIWPFPQPKWYPGAIGMHLLRLGKVLDVLTIVSSGKQETYVSVFVSIIIRFRFFCIFLHFFHFSHFFNLFTFQTLDEEHVNLVQADHLNHSSNHNSFVDDPTWLNLVDEFKYEAAKVSGKSKFSLRYFFRSLID